MPEESKLATVYIAAGQAEAEIVKGRLESEGIPVMLRYESLGAIYGIIVDGLGQVEIQVPVSMEHEAKLILECGDNASPDQEPIEDS